MRFRPRITTIPQCRVKRPGACEVVIVAHRPGSGVPHAIQLSNGNLLSCGGDASLRQWTLDGIEIGAPWRGHARSVRGAIETPSRQVLSWCSERDIDLDKQDVTTLAIHHWTNDGKPIDVPWVGHEREIRFVVRAADNCFASVDRRGEIISWSEDGALLRRGHLGLAGVRVIDLNDRIVFWGDTVVAVFDRNMSRVAGWHTPEALHGLCALRDGTFVTWGNDKNWWQNGYSEKTARRWSAEGKEIGVPARRDIGRGLIELRDGRFVTWNDHVLCVLAEDLSATTATWEGHGGAVWGAIELADGRVLSWSEDGTLRVWSTSVKANRSSAAHNGAILGAIPLANDQILTWGRDDSLRLWSKTGAPIGAPWTGHSDDVLGAIELPSGNILSWARDKALVLWNPLGAKLGEPWMGHRKYVLNVRLGLEGEVISYDGQATRTWTASGASLGDERLGPNLFGRLQLSDGGLLVWKYGDWHLTHLSEKGPRRWAGHDHHVMGALQLPDERVISWSRDGTLRSWSLEGTPIGEPWRGHRGEVLGATHCGDQGVLSWGYDRTLRLWTTSGEPIDCTAVGASRILWAEPHRVLAERLGQLLIYTTDLAAMEQFRRRRSD